MNRELAPWHQSGHTFEFENFSNWLTKESVSLLGMAKDDLCR